MPQVSLGFSLSLFFHQNLVFDRVAIILVVVSMIVERFGCFLVGFEKFIHLLLELPLLRLKFALILGSAHALPHRLT